MSKSYSLEESSNVPSIELKKLTLIAWTKLLLKEKKISLAKYNKMVARFEKLTK